MTKIMCVEKNICEKNGDLKLRSGDQNCWISRQLQLIQRLKKVTKKVNFKP